MHKMTIATSGCDTAYCTEHNGETVVCAVERPDGLEKFYYCNGDHIEGSPLDFSTLTTLDVARAEDILCEIDTVVRVFNRNHPFRTKDIETMIEWLNANAGEVVSELMSENFGMMGETQMGVLTVLSRVNPNILRIMIDGSNPPYTHPHMPKPTQIHIEEARQHIEQGEFIAKQYNLGDAVIGEAYHVVSKRIAELLEMNANVF